MVGEHGDLLLAQYCLDHTDGGERAADLCTGGGQLTGDVVGNVDIEAVVQGDEHPLGGAGAIERRHDRRRRSSNVCGVCQQHGWCLRLTRQVVGSTGGGGGTEHNQCEHGCECPRTV